MGFLDMHYDGLRRSERGVIIIRLKEKAELFLSRLWAKNHFAFTSSSEPFIYNVGRKGYTQYNI